MNREAGRLLRSALHRRRREFLRIAGWSFVQAVPALLSGWVIARAVDDGFLAGRPGQGAAWLGVLAVAVLVGAWGTRHTALGLASVVEPFRDELVTLVTTGTLHRSARHGEPADTGSVARLTEHVEIAREAYGAVIMFVQTFLITAVSVVLGLAALDPALLLLVLPPLLLGLGVFLSALRAMAARQRAVVVADERLAETMSAAAGGLRDVVACGAEERVEARTGERIDASVRAARALARLTALRTAALGISGWVPLLLILAGTPWLVRGGVSAGAILGAVAYVSQGLQPALQDFVRGLAGSGLWLAVSLARIAEAARTPPEEDKQRADVAPRKREAGPEQETRRPSVELCGVTFGYAGSAEPVIRDLDLRLDPGHHLAVVGPSGAGKSTLAALVAGLLVPLRGQVLLGGDPVRAPVACAPAALAGRRVLIPQEAYVFDGTLRENLAYLSPDAPAAELDRAVESVGAGPLAERLGGYDAPLDPQELSAGERQLLALARAYLPPAQLVLLDEATCHLDPAAEAVAEQAFARRPGTLIVIAHRISSALRADVVLVLDGPQTRLGTHEELMASSALYRDLVGHWEATARPPAPAPAAASPAGPAPATPQTPAPEAAPQPAPAPTSAYAYAVQPHRARRTHRTTE
ncbi:ATP-binding cassette domain-containing protein [Streptomyces agglomeratus]|uniref:ATP-binding cassette domain-containing protein n=1 Tax=Streptomyces agglomeratus TaxID=285458 RepID=UPI00085441AC|nr:ABC transporter ATP-binding protein [Streptomyces agglomeratus]OEJ52596.1 ABC transporter [Streptomyces agglomeratus]